MASAAGSYCFGKVWLQPTKSQKARFVIILRQFSKQKFESNYFQLRQYIAQWVISIVFLIGHQNCTNWSKISQFKDFENLKKRYNIVCTFLIQIGPLCIECNYVLSANTWRPGMSPFTWNQSFLCSHTTLLLCSEFLRCCLPASQDVFLFSCTLVLLYNL